MTPQHAIRALGCLLCAAFGVAAAYDGLTWGDLGFAPFVLYLTYAVATTEVDRSEPT